MSTESTEDRPSANKAFDDALRNFRAPKDISVAGAEYSGVPFNHPAALEAAIAGLQTALQADAISSIAPDDALEQAREEAVTSIQAMLAEVTGDERSKIEALMTRISGAATVEGIKRATAEIKQAVTEAIAATRSEHAMNALEELEEKRKHLWSEIGELNEDIRKKMLAAYERGDITKDEYESWEKKQDYADSLQEDDPAKVKAIQAAALEADKTTKIAEQRAIADGRTSDAQQMANTNQIAKDIFVKSEDLAVLDDKVKAAKAELKPVTTQNNEFGKSRVLESTVSDYSSILGGVDVTSPSSPTVPDLKKSDGRIIQG